MSEKNKIAVLAGFQVLSVVSAVIDGHTTFFNGYFVCLAWASLLIGAILAGFYAAQNIFDLD